MDLEKLNYPWRSDLDKLQSEIETLKAEIMNLRMQNDNLKYFLQQLYDRLNLAQTNYNSQPVNRPY
jgi:SMC interacting uncharacterized protein involved in chromosome segregation